ncbi:hypothetical protein ABB37_08231 [Leptomonas pyrrhocoris]|uniref:RING-type domain-containing protein n=1 Tax=Leptomonas pyrrhocoris TaxID=157538 RepID=A0A0M9FTI8_LEPPY|nr:hypothetical protein ABB37_08231 [Leptomonas pyrrhocoris]KPA75667.1 hypothetical protein ABB37_08231 [Leptomonas pyrrhocoris]|eukprot:XP_015654106.1 hypothetical protein ABB37_08231 [Leptomonas pyrrhocoris]
MYYGKQEAQGGQRGAFSRLMAARRASEVPTSRTSATASGAASSTPRLPTLAKGGETTPASAPLSSSSHLVASHHSSSGNGGGNAAPTGRQGTPDIPSYVITERTPRAELLAIISELQRDLTQRTDSVNAIQRNFQRLSAMHHAEQEELQRLRRLQQERQYVVPPPDTDAALREQRRLVEELKAELTQREQESALLRKEAARSLEQHRHAVDRSGVEHVLLQERQNIAYAEAQAFMELMKTSTAELSRLAAEREVRDENRQKHEHLLRVLRAHTERLGALQLKIRGDSIEAGANTPVPLQAELRSSAFSGGELTAVAAELQRAEEAATFCLAGYASAAAQRHTSASTAAQQQLAALTAKTDDAQHALCRTLISCEREARCSLEGAAADTAAALLCSFQQLKVVAESTALRAVAVTSQLERTRAQCSEYVDQWTASADGRLHELHHHIDSWCASFESDLSAHRKTVEQHGQVMRELAAARTEWEALRDTERKAHKAELAHVRQDTAAKVATAESRLKASQQQSSAVQKALEDAHAAHQREMQDAEQHVQERCKEAAAEREVLLSRQWFRVQSAQEQCTAEAMSLLWDVSCVRRLCYQEEAEARMALYAAHVQAAARLSQQTTSQKVLAGVSQAVWATHATHLSEGEAAARLLVETKAQEEFVELVCEEEGGRRGLCYNSQLARLHQEVDEARVKTAEMQAKHRRREEQLEADLHLAEEERRAALSNASDAAAAAAAARRAEQKVAEELLALKSSTAAAAERIEAAESATESACCCSLCLQLLHNPIACVPCGHVFCAGCLLWHTRNKSLSSLSAAGAAGGPQLSRRVSGGAPPRIEVEVAQWMRGLTVPQARLYCPECGGAPSVSTVVELRALGDLAAKYTYKRGALKELMRDLL